MESSASGVPLPSSVVIVGCARDAARFLPMVLHNIERIASLFGTARAIIHENDSRDDTLKVLTDWSRSTKLESLVLSEHLPERHRIDAIARSRNRILDRLEQDGLDRSDYLVVMDLDDANGGGPIELSGVLSSFRPELDWDGIGANQLNGYYDLFALRTARYDRNPWGPGGVLREDGLPQPLSVWFDGEVFARGSHIPEGLPPLPVLSAFGGLAIYRMDAIRGLRYEPEVVEQDDGTQDRDCEHVGFHRKMRERGRGRIFINPRMLNGSYSPLRRWFFGPLRGCRLLANRLSRAFGQAKARPQSR